MVREELKKREQELIANEQERTTLKGKLETVEMNYEQLNEQLNATSRNLDQALDR